MTREASPAGRRTLGPPATVRFWVFFLLTALAAFSGAAGHLAARVPTYSTQALIAFVPLGERPVSAAAVELMVPRYVAYATSPFVVRQVAAATGLPAGRLQSQLTVSMAATTANVGITMVSSDPELATSIANRIAALVVERAAADPVLGARLLASAAVPADPQGPSGSALLAGAAAASVLLGLAAGLLGRSTTRRVGGRRRWELSPGALAPRGAVPAWPGPDRFRPAAKAVPAPVNETNPWGAALAAGRIPPPERADADIDAGQPGALPDPGHTAPFSFVDLADEDPDLEPEPAPGPAPEPAPEPARAPEPEPEPAGRRTAAHAGRVRTRQ